MGKYGLAVDNLLGVELVLADGESSPPAKADDPDLFWAIRGGGGNFGAVTSFEYEASIRSDMIFGGIAAHPLAAAGEVFHFYLHPVHEDPPRRAHRVRRGSSPLPDGSGMKIVATPVLSHCGDLEAGRVGGAAPT